MGSLKYYDLLQFLKGYGTFIFTRDKLADLDLIEEEMKELFKLKLIDSKYFAEALMTIQREREKEIRKRKTKSEANHLEEE